MSGKRRSGRSDLAGRVVRGEVSADAAAIQVGHRSPMIAVPAEPRAAGRRPVRHFTPDQFNVLVATALDLYGVPRGENP